MTWRQMHSSIVTAHLDCSAKSPPNGGKRRGSMEETAARRAAETLLAEHQANARFKTLGPPHGPATIADAYDIQDRYVALLQGKHGKPVGYKVGLTSATMQTFCGIDHPIGG